MFDEPLLHYPLYTDSDASLSRMVQKLMKKLENRVFLKVVDNRPSKLVRAPVAMESELQSADVAVQVHAVLEIRERDKLFEFVVDTAPAYS